MTNNSPIESQSSSDDDLGFEDFIGILVAFVTIGTILFWSFSRKESNWNFGNFFSKATTKDRVQSNENSNLNNLTQLLAPTPEPNNNIKSRQPVIEPEANQKNPIVLETEALNAVIPPFLLPLPENQLPRDLDKMIPASGASEDNSKQVSSNAGDGKPKTSNTPVAVNTPKATATATPTPTQTPTPQATATKLPTIPPPKNFTDIPDDFWAKAFIDKLSSRKVIEGYENNSYRPQQPVNRAEFAAIIDKAFQTDITNNQKAFKDIKDGFWAQSSVDKAVSKKFMSGYPGDVFQPEKKIPRVEVIVSLVTGLNLNTPTSPDKVLSIYKDADQIPEWARDKVAAATANKLVVNHPDPNSFNPNKEATRAEVATMVHQALVKMNKLEPIKSTYVVGQ